MSASVNTPVPPGLKRRLVWSQAGIFNKYKTNLTLLQKRFNFHTYLDNFICWNGAYRPLEKLIKASMHDDSFYKHHSTL